MKVIKKPMPIYQKIFYILSFIFLIFAFVYLGNKEYKKTQIISDAETFTKEFGITKNNLYTYKSAKEILETMNSSSAIIFFAYPENKWSATYAEILNEVAKKYDISEILYYNIEKDRRMNNYYYEHITEKLTDYLSVLDDDSKNIYVPAVAFIKDGEVIYYDDETSITKGDISINDYWTSAKINQKKAELNSQFQKYKGLI